MTMMMAVLSPILRALLCVLAVVLSASDGRYLAAADATASSEKRMMDCTIDSATLDDCDAQAYAIRVGVFAAPGIIMFLLLWLCCPFYCCGKYCCNCCGGRHQTPNCCCPADKYPARYSQGDLIRPRVYGVIAMLLVGGSLGWGFSGLFELLDGLDSLRVVIEEIPDELQGRIDAIQASLVVDTYSAATQGTSQRDIFAEVGLGNASQTLRTDLKKEIDKLMQQYREYVGYITQAIIALFAVPAAVLIIGQLTSLCSCRKFIPMIMVWMLFIFGGLLWLGHGLFSGLSMAIGDVCAEVDGMVNQQTNVLPVVLGCDDSMFDSFRNDFQAAEAREAQRACDALMTRCFVSSNSVAANIAANTVYLCPPSVNCSSQTFGSLLTLSEAYWYVHPTITSSVGSAPAGYGCRTLTPCTVEQCSTDCTANDGSLSTIGHQSKEMWSNIQATNQVANSMDTTGAQYSNCDSVMLLVMGPASSPCTKLTSGLVSGRQASGMEGVAVIMGLFVFIWGAKRFIPLDEAGKPRMEGRDDADDS